MFTRIFGVLVLSAVMAAPAFADDRRGGGDHDRGDRGGRRGGHGGGHHGGYGGTDVIIVDNGRSSCWPNCGTWGGGSTWDTDGYYYGAITCAPETVANNVQIADATLADLAANELSSAETFKVRATDLARMPLGREKADAYFKLVGIKNPSDGVEVMNFLYAREVNKAYVQSVSENLQLSNEQAAVLVQKMTQALKPRQ